MLGGKTTGFAQVKNTLRKVITGMRDSVNRSIYRYMIRHLPALLSTSPAGPSLTAPIQNAGFGGSE